MVVSKTLDILKNKATIGKGDREIIIAGIQRLINHFTDNVPFVQKQFQEGMEKVVLEAKSDIEAFVENKIRTAGLEAIANSNNITPLIDNK